MYPCFIHSRFRLETLILSFFGERVDNACILCYDIQAEYGFSPQTAGALLARKHSACRG